MRLSPLLWLAVFGCGCAHVRKPSRPVHAMSFNIRYATPKDRDNRWEKRKELVVRVIRARDPDLFGLQEALPKQTRFVADALPAYDHYTLGRRGPDVADEACPVFWRRTRFECLARETLWLGPDPKRVAKAWDAALPRICSWVRLRDRESNETFVFANVHFDHRGKRAREQSAALIATQWPDERVVLTGDLNAGESSKPLANLRDGGFVDSFRVVHPNAEFVGTYSGFRVRSRKKIDYVLLRGEYEVEGARIDDTRFDDRWPSDHLPVTATFRWKPRRVR